MENLLKVIKEELAKINMASISDIKRRVKTETFADGSLTVMIDGEDIAIFGNSRDGF